MILPWSLQWSLQSNRDFVMFVVRSCDFALDSSAEPAVQSGLRDVFCEKLKIVALEFAAAQLQSNWDIEHLPQHSTNSRDFVTEVVRSFDLPRRS